MIGMILCQKQRRGEKNQFLRNKVVQPKLYFRNQLKIMQSWFLLLDYRLFLLYSLLVKNYSKTTLQWSPSSLMFYTKQILFCEGLQFFKCCIVWKSMHKLRLGVSFGLLRLTSWVGLDAVIKNYFFKIRITLSILLGFCNLLLCMSLWLFSCLFLWTRNSLICTNNVIRFV